MRRVEEPNKRQSQGEYRSLTAYSARVTEYNRFVAGPFTTSAQITAVFARDFPAPFQAVVSYSTTCQHLNRKPDEIDVLRARTDGKCHTGTDQVAQYQAVTDRYLRAFNIEPRRSLEQLRSRISDLDGVLRDLPARAEPVENFVAMQFIVVEKSVMEQDVDYPLKMRDATGNIAANLGTVSFDTQGMISVSGIAPELAIVVRFINVDRLGLNDVDHLSPSGGSILHSRAAASLLSVSLN